MSTVYTDITLKNAGDLTRVQDGRIKEKDVRSVTVNALVDTGAGTLVITESVRRKLGLEIKGSRSASLADNEKVVCKVTEPVDIYWKNRETSFRALGVAGAGNPRRGGSGGPNGGRCGRALGADTSTGERTGTRGRHPPSILLLENQKRWMF